MEKNSIHEYHSNLDWLRDILRRKSQIGIIQSTPKNHCAESEHQTTKDNRRTQTHRIVDNMELCKIEKSMYITVKFRSLLNWNWEDIQCSCSSSVYLLHLSNPKVISFDDKIIINQPKIQKISRVLSYCVSSIPIRSLSSQKPPTQMLWFLNICNIK